VRDSGGTWQEFKLLDAPGPLPLGGAQAIGAGVTAAQDDDVLVLGADELLVGNMVSHIPPVLEREVVHRLVDAVQFAAGDFEIARGSGPAAQHDGVEIPTQFLDLDVLTHVGVGLEDNPLGFHEPHPAIDDFLIELEVGYAVHQQATDAVGAFEDGDEMARLINLSGGGKARRARADDGNLFPRSLLGNARRDPSLGERMIDDVLLDQLDRNRLLVDPQDAGFFARGGTDPARELGKVVGL